MDMKEYGGPDDDIFYDDLKRRILSLMMEEDEADGFGGERKSPARTGTNYSPPFPFHGRSSIDGFWKDKNEYESSCTIPNVHGIPLFITEDPNTLNIWAYGLFSPKESSGTGVFIPRSPKLRRKSKARKNNHENICMQGRIYK